MTTRKCPIILTICVAALRPAGVCFVCTSLGDCLQLVLFWLLPIATDFVDGIWRGWKQVKQVWSQLLDPVIAIKRCDVMPLLITAFSVFPNRLALDWLAATFIISFAEVFVSGLREFGPKAGRTEVTTVDANVEPTAQMVPNLFFMLQLSYVRACISSCSLILYGSIRVTPNLLPSIFRRIGLI